MAISLFSVMTLVLGVYLIFQSDKLKGSGQKALYAIAGLMLALWGLTMVFGVGVSAQIGATPVLFGIFALLAFYTKGANQAIAGAVAIIIFLSMVF
ncbi:MAG: hypothetical protein JXB14_00560 [Candidatus Altiarchaeota archaeon]|nr:hypothetical protein [Candidatus Altiarchaeota archaeon]